jgi:ferredoxin--NADP+ reductase
MVFCPKELTCMRRAKDQLAHDVAARLEARRWSCQWPVTIGQQAGGLGKQCAARHSVQRIVVPVPAETVWLVPCLANRHKISGSRWIRRGARQHTGCVGRTRHDVAGPWISVLGKQGMATQEYNAVVLERVDVSPGLMILRVGTVGWPTPSFKAGQYTVLGMLGSAPRAPETDAERPPPEQDKLIRRAYSVASSSKDEQYLEFYVSLVKSGALTPRLFALQRGSKLWLSPKMTGMFTMDKVPADTHIVLIATGTGLAPYMSMLRTHLGESNDRHVLVVQGARHSWDLGYRAELMTMQRLSPRLTYLPIISNPEEEVVPWTGLTGLIDDWWGSETLIRAWQMAPSPATTHVFLCGNPLMIEAMLKVLGVDGYVEHTPKQPGQIHLEKFW